MTGSSSTQPNVSSAPLLKGMPSFLHDISVHAANYKAAVSQALEDIASEEQDALRGKAQEQGGPWADLSEHLSVSYDHDARELKYSATAPADSQHNPSDLEFGNLETPPSPLLRRTAAENRDSFGSRVTSRTHQLLRSIR